jgi:hypothetical protein
MPDPSTLQEVVYTAQQPAKKLDFQEFPQGTAEFIWPAKHLEGHLGLWHSLILVGAPAFMRGEERFSAPEKS